MKMFICSAGLLIVTARASAQFVVQDPLMLAQHALELARLGDPSALRNIAGVEELRQLYNMIRPGLALGALQQTASAAYAFGQTGNGLYRPVFDHVLTTGGALISRAESEYRKFNALSLTVENFKAVEEEIESAISNLRHHIGSTLEKLASAATQAEVEKLQAVLTAQQGQLSSLERERDQALARVLVQDIENRNDQLRQQQARIEDRTAAFQDAQRALGTFLTPKSGPVKIPAPTRR